MIKDKLVFEYIEKEKIRQTHGIELIASENFVSEQVMAAAGSVLTNNMPKDYLEKDIMVDVKLLMK